MNRQSIRTFLAIVERKSISAAARELRLTQQTVSEHLGHLEKRLGTPLVVRTRGTRQISLTSAGEAFVPLARLWEELDGEVEAFVSAQKKRAIRLAASVHGHDVLVPHIVPRLLLRDPELEVCLSNLENQEIEAAVKRRGFDAVISYGSASLSEAAAALTTCKLLFAEERYILCPANSTLPDRILTPDDLNPGREVYYSPYDGYTAVRQWREENFRSNVAPYFRVSTLMSVARYVTAPDCWAMLPASVVLRHVDQEPTRFSYRRCDPAIPGRKCYLYVEKHYSDEDAIRNLVDSFDEYLRENPLLHRRED